MKYLYQVILPKNEDNIEKIGVIDGLRGIAILGVIYHHTVCSQIYALIPFPNIVRSGWLGVNLFFILSGFVLFRPYLLGKREMQSWADVRSFYKHRFQRLYPLFTLNCLVAFLFVAKPSPENFKSLCLTLSSLNAYMPNHGFFPVFNWVLWSLIVEIWFSLFFPVLLFLLQKKGYVITTLLCMFIPLGIKYFGVAYYPQMNLLKHGWFCRIDDFWVGICVCKLYYDNSKIAAKNPYLLFFIGLFLSVIAMFLYDIRRRGMSTVYIEPMLYTLIQAGFGLLVLSALKGGNIWSKICNIWILRIFGVMCFSLYVWHGIIMPSFIHEETLREYLPYFFFTLLFSIVSYRFIEFGQVKDWKKLFLI